MENTTPTPTPEVTVPTTSLDLPKAGIVSKVKTWFTTLPKSQKIIGISSAVILLSVVVVASRTVLSSPSTAPGHGAAGDGLDDLLGDIDAGSLDEQTTINCLNDKGVTLYLGASCGFTKAEVQQKGKKMKEFAIVDCDEDSELCDMAGITQLPSRCADGKCVGDIFSVKDLATEFGCN